MDIERSRLKPKTDVIKGSATGRQAFLPVKLHQGIYRSSGGTHIHPGENVGRQ